MHEVPGPEPPLLALDEQQALAREHEEVLLVVLAVVHACGLAGLQHADIDPDLREPRLALEPRVGAEVALPPERLARVQHEPALALGNEAGGGPKVWSFFNH